MPLTRAGSLCRSARLCSWSAAVSRVESPGCGRVVASASAARRSSHASGRRVIEGGHTGADPLFEVDRQRLELLDEVERVAVGDAVLVPLVAIVDLDAAAVDGADDVEIHVDAGRFGCPSRSSQRRSQPRSM